MWELFHESDPTAPAAPPLPAASPVIAGGLDDGVIARLLMSCTVAGRPGAGPAG